MQYLKLFYEAVPSSDAKTAQSFTEQALAASVEPLRLVNESMVSALDEMGGCRLPIEMAGYVGPR